MVWREELSKSAPRAITEEQQRRLLRLAERAPARDRAIVVLMVYTGLRLAGFVALDVDVRVSARKGLVIVRSGKGDAYREVPLNALVRQVLRSGSRSASGARRKASARSCWGCTGHRLLNRSVDDVVRGLGEDAGVKLSAHILRHTFLTRMVRQGSDLVLVAVGRASPVGDDPALQPAVGCRPVVGGREPTDRLLTARDADGFLFDAEIERLERFPETIDRVTSPATFNLTATICAARCGGLGSFLMS